MRRLTLALALAVVPVGVVADAAGDPPLVALDLAVGLVLAGAAAALALLGRAPLGAVVACAALAWFAGSVEPDLAYAHRAVLALAVVAAPVALPRSGRAWLAVAVAAICSLPLDRPDLAALVAAVAVVAARPRSLPAVALAAALAWVPLGRWLLPEATDPTLALYDLAIAAVGPLLAWSVLEARRRMVDLVVEVGGAGGLASIEAALAPALGDPTVRVGRWLDAAGAYVDDEGAPLPERPAGVTAMTIERAGDPLAIVQHRGAALDDPALRVAVAAGVRLVAENAELQAALERDAAALAESRRRLLDSADRQRRQLARRLSAGPMRRLAAVEPALAALPEAALLLEGSRAELAALGRGLYPGALARGDLETAVHELATGAPLPIDVEVRAHDVSPTLGVAVYFVAAEAVANALKHAAASRIDVAVVAEGPCLTVTVVDDGTGGADPCGRGLRGLADRVEALGGTFTVSSGGGGTRVEARLELASAIPGQLTGRHVPFHIDDSSSPP